MMYAAPFSRAPVSMRRHIPFYCEKTEAAFRRDPYENYEGAVKRRLLLHYGESLTGVFPYAEITKIVESNLPQQGRVLEIGCGTGRLIGTAARAHPGLDFYGVDYAYQMLRAAADYWTAGRPMSLSGADRGWASTTLSAHRLTNLYLAMARAEDLPFGNAAFRLVFHAFLLDRLADIDRALHEMYRVLAPGGRLLSFLPANFLCATDWEKSFPVKRIIDRAEAVGFRTLAAPRTFLIDEPLDAAGNLVRWNCRSFSMIKPND